MSTLTFFLGRWSAQRESATSLPTLADVAPEVAAALYAPPPGHGEVKVPSVAKDIRGEVHNLQIGGFRFNILVSSAGSLRSGDVHKSNQLDFIFAGRVVVTTREHGRDMTREYGAGSYIIIPKMIPHIFYFLNTTVMAEWWDGPFECRYYRPYRRLVDRAMKTLASGSPTKNKVLPRQLLVAIQS
eukprot:CAMPEP_0119330014 /NCGR_PEP_ID=MMETSP1333-20130426/77309_1 /TAXON_ID=418940 /ORGANISM="Scyphosphaera apsteinii, Strain RCC1455" /LENGTH=184 /DNA_ID=CAMNT_0007339291 /DNA_START=76 /DNA_END=630 /DNA_ORIENTATION=+